MDVTSLLNTSSVAAAASSRCDQNRRSESVDQTPTPSVTRGTTVASTTVPTPSPEPSPLRRISISPNRSRTPWDAGGYSLPLMLETKLAQTPSTARFCSYPDSPVERGTSLSPNSSRHKFSDSRSSVSSYLSSSNNSQSHSRFSSLSTVSEFQPLASVLGDSYLLHLRQPSTDGFDLASLAKAPPILGEVQPPSPFLPSHSQADSFYSNISQKMASRPGSPSDKALAVKHDHSTPQPAPMSSHFLRPEMAPSRTHKRALSAPNFAASHNVDSSSTEGNEEETSTRPSSVDNDHKDVVLDDTIKCMFVEHCDTNSQPRKAISHIFGRNKLCTRLIPSHVWVHFCRKHYQRTRYRNAQEYAKLQSELVLKQLARVQAWSDQNKSKGKGGVVQDWSLTVRKREQKRLDDKSKKRPYQDDSQDEADGQGDHAVALGTAVPQWLLEKTGSGYSTAEVEDIVRQLKQEMEENRLAQIPDIEILPNISTDGTEEVKTNAYVKRKTSPPKKHKRAHSMVTSLQSMHSSFPMDRRISQPSVGYWGTGPDFSSPVEKRARIEHDYQDVYASPPGRVVPIFNHRIGPLAHRQVFPGASSQEDRAYHTAPAPPMGYHMSMSSGNMGPLPAPTPQRVAPLITEQLESSHARTMHQEQHATRPFHHRAYSDVPALRLASQAPQHASSSQGYTVGHAGMGNFSFEPSAAPSYTYEYAPSYTTNTHGPSGYHEELSTRQPHYPPPPPQHYETAVASSQSGPMGGAAKHARHQSTPNAARPMQPTRSYSHASFSMAPSPTSYESAPSGYHHARHQSYASRSSMPRVDEDQSLYADRK